MMAWKVPGVSNEGNELIEIYFPEWEKKYGVNTFTVDAKTGQMYIFKYNKLQHIEERCSTKPTVGKENYVNNPIGWVRFWYSNCENSRELVL